MADHARRQSRSVKHRLYGDASRFTFLQAVRLMEEIELRKRPLHRCPGEAAHAADELLVFRHKIRLDMPPADVETIEDSNGAAPVMTTNVLGLAGVLAPLPHPVTERLIDELRHGRDGKDHGAFAAFLDIFNHRLISLLYRARKKYRPALDHRSPHDGRVARVLYALLGLGTPHLRGRVLHRVAGRDADRPLLACAGLFAENYRSPAGLERIVEEHFGVRAEVVPFIGEWNEIDEDDRTAIGAKSGRNNRLGKTALAGRRIWNQAARFEVRLGPLPFKRFRTFLPSTHDAYTPLVRLIRFYTHEELAFDIRLVLDRQTMPRLRLRIGGGDAHLGHSTWLVRWRPKHDDHQVRLAGRR